MNIFIGSSKEAAQSGLLSQVAVWIEENGHTPIPWNKNGLFPPGTFTLHQLQGIASDVGAAVLIFTEDDKKWYRDEVKVGPRDNVMLEYGLFVGRLDSQRTIICKKGKPNFASDIHGITFIDLDKESKAKVEFGIWLDAIKGMASIKGTRLITCYTNKYAMNDSNTYWHNLRVRAKKMLVIMGGTNKSWINRDPDENYDFAKQIIELVKENGTTIGLITSKKGIEPTKFFVKKYIIELVNSQKEKDERRKIKKLLIEKFKYCVIPHVNYKAILSDDKIVILPNLFTHEFQDESMVLELNQGTHYVEYDYYLQDIKRIINGSRDIKSLNSIYDDINT
jgi:hypothetical protein